MPKEISKWINNHELPEAYFRFPWLLWLQWLTSRVLYHRSWLIRQSVGISLRRFRNDISYLDAGCGAGDFLIPFARQHKQGNFYGIDQSGSNVRMLNHYCKGKCIDNVNVKTAYLEEMGTGNRYTVVLCASVLQYLSNHRQVLENLAGNMISGGHLILYVPINYRRRLPGYKWLRETVFRTVDYEGGKSVRTDLSFGILSEELAEVGFTIDSHRELYGVAGQIGYEITSLALLMIQKVPWVFSVFLTLFYFPVIHPFVLLLMIIDFFSRNEQGNGLLVVAVRN